MSRPGRRQFLKLLGLSPALPAASWLPAEQPAPAPQLTADQVADAVQKGIRDALLDVEERNRRAVRSLNPFTATAMGGYRFFRREEED
jgi:hypothetical protein